MTHDELRIATGALALGSLDDDEAAEVRSHLVGCPECQREYEEFRGIPMLLGLVPAGEVLTGPPVATEAARDELLARVVAERKAKERRGYVNRFAGALALAAAAAVVGFVVAEGTQDDVPPADFTLAATDEATGVWARVDLNDVGWGTKISLALSGVEIGENCRLVAVSDSGGETIASDWTVPETDREYITVPGAVGVHPDEINYFDVVTNDGVLLVRIPIGTGPTHAP